MEDLSVSDIASVVGNKGDFGGNSWIVLILLFAMIYGGGFGFGNRGGEQYATTADVQRSTDFAALERQNNEIQQTVMESAGGVTSAIKDASYSNLSEVRDLQTAVNTGFTNMQNCCCSIERGIDSVNYNGAINTASINANTTAQTQKILDVLCANRQADMQNEINNLRTQIAMSGVVRYPSASTYYAGTNPFCGCSCNGTI